MNQVAPARVCVNRTASRVSRDNSKWSPRDTETDAWLLRELVRCIPRDSSENQATFIPRSIADYPRAASYGTEAVRGGGRAKQLYVVPGAGHNDVSGVGGLGYDEVLRGFLDRHGAS